MCAFTKPFLLVFLSLFIGFASFSQSRKDLEKKKNDLVKDIEYKNKLLEETKKNQEATLGQLLLLNQKITKRQELINTISHDVELLTEQIAETADLIEALENDLAKYKEEYAKLIYHAFITRSNYEKIMFLFASKDLDQAYRRLKYLQQYAQYRQSQAELIEKTKEQLNKKKQTLEKQKLEKINLLKAEQQEKNQLYTEKGLQQNYISDLKNKEKQIKKEIKQKQEEAEKLKKAIQKLIEEELKRQEEAKKKTGFALTPEAKALSDDFTANQGKLPWPVASGVITQRFGEQPHPVLKNIKINNNGIDISTEKGADARAVFSGTVTGVLVFQGAGKAVIIRHGEYLTVYTNLAEVFVKMNDVVSLKQPIGKVLFDSSKGITELHFEIWKGQTIMNPSSWLYNAK